MKSFFTAFLLIFSISSLAGEGMIIVLEAPFFRERSWDSLVVQNVRKGDKIFIHDKHMGVSTYEVDYGVVRDLEALKDKEGEGFYQTLDNNGLPAYVPKKYVKLIYKDTREFEMSVTPFEKDPTDYRLEEPLPKGYPLYPIDKWRASFSFAFGPGTKNNYLYPKNVAEEVFSSRKGIEIFYTRKVEFDPYDRFYFGGVFHLYGEEAQFDLEDLTESKESKGQLGIGPFASYDVFRTKENILTFGAGITLNWNRYLVNQRRADISEERLFTGFSFTPKLTAFYQRKNILMENLSFIVGSEMQLNLSHALNSSTEPTVQEFWNNELSGDQFLVPTGAQYTIFFGIQTTTE